MTITVRLTEADYRAGVQRVHFKSSWDRVKTEARSHALERLIEKNRKATDAAMDASPRLTGVQWLRNSDELTRLFAEHDELMDLAYPESTKAAIAARKTGGAR